MKKYLNNLISGIKTELKEELSRLQDPVTKIRLKETIKLLNPIKQNESVKDDVISNLMQYVDLIDALKSQR